MGSPAAERCATFPVPELPPLHVACRLLGFEIRAGTSDAFAAVYKREWPVWQRMVKQSGAKVE